MKRKLATIVLLLVAGLADASEVNWPEFMARHRMTWNSMPKSWTQAPHFGNGLIGSMLYEGGDFHLKPVGRITGCEFTKNIWDAELTGTVMTDAGTIGIRHFVHHEDMVIVTEIDPSGMWFQGGSWPYTTNDHNTQVAHWPLYAANRLQLSQPLVDALHDNRQALIDSVEPVAWREDSAFLHVTTARDLYGPRIQDRRYYNLVGCLPWTMHNCWLQ